MKTAEQSLASVRKDTRITSVPWLIEEHPDFEALVEAGESALPVLFDDLKQQPSMLTMMALSAITGERPYPSAADGQMQAMANGWIKWGKANNIVEKDWDESEHPRDEDGKFTDSGGGDGSSDEAVSTWEDVSETPSVPNYQKGVTFDGTARAAKEIKNKWAAESTIRTADQMIAAAPKAQARLASIGGHIANKLSGVEFKNPGEKTNNAEGIARFRAKVATREGVAARVSDVARCGFVVKHPQQTEAVAKELGKYFEVALENWRQTDAGYIDRALTVRMPNGMMAEVQMMDPWTAKAKSSPKKGGGGGHDLYNEWREIKPKDNPAELARYDKLLKQMRELYADAMSRYTPEWKAALLTD